jgi:hypothetical protein
VHKKEDGMERREHFAGKRERKGIYIRRRRTSKANTEGKIHTEQKTRPRQIRGKRKDKGRDKSRQKLLHKASE